MNSVEWFVLQVFKSCGFTLSRKDFYPRNREACRSYVIPPFVLGNLAWVRKGPAAQTPRHPRVTFISCSCGPDVSEIPGMVGICDKQTSFHLSQWAYILSEHIHMRDRETERERDLYLLTCDSSIIQQIFFESLLCVGYWARYKIKRG